MIHSQDSITPQMIEAAGAESSLLTFKDYLQLVETEKARFNGCLAEQRHKFLRPGAVGIQSTKKADYLEIIPFEIKSQNHNMAVQDHHHCVIDISEGRFKEEFWGVYVWYFIDCDLEWISRPYWCTSKEFKMRRKFEKGGVDFEYGSRTKTIQNDRWSILVSQTHPLSELDAFLKNNFI